MWQEARGCYFMMQVPVDFLNIASKKHIFNISPVYIYSGENNGLIVNSCPKSEALSQSYDIMLYYI